MASSAVDPEPSHFTLALSGRSFAGTTETNYGSLVLGYQSPTGLRFLLAGSTGRNDSFDLNGQTITFGGREAEAKVEWRQPQCGAVLGLGILFPTSPAQHANVLTYSVAYDLQPGLTASLLGVMGSDSVSGLRLKKTLPLQSNTDVVFEGTVIWLGNSSVSTNTASSIRTFLGSALYVYRLSPTQTAKFGLTNTLGETTAMSLASPVGNHWGLYAGMEVKF